MNILNISCIKQNNLVRVIDFLKTYKFLSVSDDNKTLFSFSGKLLQQNVSNEWFFSNLLSRDEPVFLVDHLDKDFLNIKEFCNEKLPFSLIEVKNGESGQILRCSTFCNPKFSVEFYHKWLRVKKTWWRKFSSEPGRFNLTEIQQNDERQVADIIFESAWITEAIESVIHKPVDSSEMYEFKEGRKKYQPNVITSEINLNQAAMIYLIDGYETEPREQMLLHRKLTPYQISFAVSSTSADICKQLTELSLVTSRQLHKIKIRTLLLPDVGKTGLDLQFQRNDRMGVSYTVILTEKTLKDGIVHLRSRDTTVKEQCHIGNLKTYLEQIMRNY